jgi:hypothetical protein
MKPHQPSLPRKAKRTQEEALSAKLGRQSAEEQRSAAVLLATLEEKEAMRRARLEREEQYREARAAQLVEARARDAAAAALLREEYLARIEASGSTRQSPSLAALSWALARAHARTAKQLVHLLDLWAGGPGGV